MEWVRLVQPSRLHSAIGYLSPAEAQANYYNQLSARGPSL